MGYKTVLTNSFDKFSEKKSIFIGHCSALSTEESAKEILNSIKLENREAKHNVYAYILGANQEIQRYSDDGEPKGTAGIPILEILKKNNLTNTIIVVTRYFGGILLGSSNLLRAYNKSASNALKNNTIVEKVIGQKVNLIVSYNESEKIQYFFSKNDFYTENIIYTDKVSFELYIEKENLDNFKEKFISLTNARCDFLISNEQYFYKGEKKLFL